MQSKAVVMCCGLASEQPLFMDRQGYSPAVFGVHMCNSPIPLLNSVLLLKYLQFYKNKSNLFPKAI